MSNGSLNGRWTALLIECLRQAGVRHAVLSPGSRCTPITLACDACLHTNVIVDERSAAYYAIGLAKATARPVVLVCTSGTAAANWYPAVVEANHSQVPLILVTADRPPELYGLGANQTIDQVKLFGNLVRGYYGLPPAAYRAMAALPTLAAKAVEQSLWPLPGPVHINVPLREPLFSNHASALTIPQLRTITEFKQPTLHPDSTILSSLAPQLTGPGYIICGALPYDPSLASAITTLAAALDCPIIADPLSNLRCGTHDLDHILCHYDTWISNATAMTFNPQWLLHLGTMPISKRLQRMLITLKPPLHVAVNASGSWVDPQHAVTLMVRADPTTFCVNLASLLNPPSNPNNWHSILKPLEQAARDKLANTAILPFEWQLMQQLVATLPPQATLFIGNSMPIRDLDACLAVNPKPLHIIANRGASGIDGTVSTLAGLATGSTETVVGIIGDLALFHDLNGLHNLIGLNVILIVINNGGGGIFRYLSQACLPTFTRNWLTPTKLNIAKAAELFALGYRLVNCLHTFAAALNTAFSTGGPWLIEAVVDAEASVNQHHAYWNHASNG